MTTFILSAVVLVVLALVFIVPTLLRKNRPMSDVYDEFNVAIAKDRLAELKQQREAGEISEEIFQQLHDELESTLAIDLAHEADQAVLPESNTSGSSNKLIPVLVGLAVPLMAIFVYAQLGDFNAATGKAMQAVEIPSGENRPQMTIAEAVTKLKERLAENPENPDGWYMLARTYMATQQYQQSADAYKKLLELVGDEEPQLLLNYADALAMSEGGKLTGKAKPIVEKVKAMAPNNPTVLWMSGTAESQQGNFKQALTYWYKLRPMLNDEPQAQGQLAQLIQGAESQLGDALVAELKASMPEINTAQTAQAESASPAGNTAASITVNVDLDPAYQSKVNPGDTLFIFAKALQGPPMPLAAVKLTAAALPVTVTLDDSMAMMPQMKMSNFEAVKVSAVISKSGQPGAKPGDLFVEQSPVNVFANENISLMINQLK